MIPKYEAIAADIRRSIEDGALKPGDKLPTVVEFCELYSVSKITVKRAIEQITEEGLITSRRGSGTYVKDTAGLPGQVFSRQERPCPRLSYEHRGEKVTSVVYDLDRQSAGRGCDPTGNGRRRLCLSSCAYARSMVSPSLSSTPICHLS